MSFFYVPYSGRKPKAVEINGHRLVILTKDKQILSDHLQSIGADTLRRVKTIEEPENDVGLIDKIARSAKAGIVFAPDEAPLADVIRELEQQLPWLH
jgi:hypothetical protein